MTHQLQIGSDMAEIVSYDRMKGIEKHCEYLRDMLNQQILVREELRVMLGLSREQWNILIEKAVAEHKYNLSDLDPFRTIKDICTLMAKIQMDSPDILARTIAEEVVKLCRDNIMNYVTTESV
jgi:hypothetical protein